MRVPPYGYHLKASYYRVVFEKDILDPPSTGKISSHDSVREKHGKSHERFQKEEEEREYRRGRLVEMQPILTAIRTR